jgi:hypothetical protein
MLYAEYYEEYDGFVKSAATLTMGSFFLSRLGRAGPGSELVIFLGLMYSTIDSGTAHHERHQKRVRTENQTIANPSPTPCQL